MLLLYRIEDYRRIKIEFDLIHMHDAGLCAIRIFIYLMK